MPQSLTNVLLHIIFSTKDREPLIKPEIESDLYAYINGILKKLSCPPIAMGGTKNHIHILCTLSRTLSISTVLEEIKKSSSKWVKTRGNAFTRFYWQAGYGAFSIGESTVADLKKYIARQKEHHQTVSFQDEFRAFLGKYRVDYDEKYVWD